jgi:hypothetical protein
VTEQDPVIVRRRKAMHYADLFEMTRDERIGFSEMILHRDVESWKDLTLDEWNRILDALEGAFLIRHLRTGR